MFQISIPIQEALYQNVQDLLYFCVVPFALYYLTCFFFKFRYSFRRAFLFFLLLRLPYLSSFLTSPTKQIHNYYNRSGELVGLEYDRPITGYHIGNIAEFSFNLWKSNFVGNDKVEFGYISCYYYKYSRSLLDDDINININTNTNTNTNTPLSEHTKTGVLEYLENILQNPIRDNFSLFIFDDNDVWTGTLIIGPSVSAWFSSLPNTYCMGTFKEQCGNFY